MSTDFRTDNFMGTAQTSPPVTWYDDEVLATRDDQPGITNITLDDINIIK